MVVVFVRIQMAAKLAIGYTLEIIPNDITRKTPASFEPSIDYVVTKIPRFAFEKFPGASNNLTTQMKSVGEAMAFGRTFQESFQKAWRSLETGLDGWAGCDRNRSFSSIDKQKLTNQLRVPNPDRMADIYTAFKIGMTQKEIQDITWMDPWFLSQMKQLVEAEEFVIATPLAELTAADFQALKQRGFSDSQLGKATGHPEMKIRETRKALGVRPAFKRVDTCAAEFDASTPYMYSSYDGHDEAEAENKKKVLILGGGPNRIGQGIEFDYCCCHASFSLRAAGYDTIMMNSNPETVSTDYDTSSRLYFEPLTVEDVLNVVESERPDGIVVQFGGQTPLKLATALDKALKEMQLPTSSGEGIVKIWGTSPDAIDEAEDRERFEKLLKKLDIAQPPGYAARSEKEALDAAGKIGYPVMVRPSYVLGGRAMEIVYDDDALKYYIKTAVQLDTNQPVLVDKYLSDATEIDCDALCDKDGEVTIAGIMEHIEQAGVHSGDSACSLPTQTIPAAALAEIRASTAAIARELNVVGLINIQWAVSREGKVYIIEANPRASRTVPFVAKAIGHPVAKYASLLMSGKTLKELNFTEEVVPSHVAVKEAVLPFDKFPGADALLGPEMRSTGEVMGIDASFEMAYAKAQIAAGQRLPQEGNVFISMNELNKPGAVPVAQKFEAMGFGILATGGTATVLQEAGVKVTKVLKLHEGRPHIGDLLRSGEVQLMFVTAGDDESERVDGRDLRRLALAQKVPLVTTVAGGRANASAIEGMKAAPISMDALQGFLP
jgi:carbamoyl-phosphate synthase large subunit